MRFVLAHESLVVLVVWVVLVVVLVVLAVVFRTRGSSGKPLLLPVLKKPPPGPPKPPPGLPKPPEPLRINRLVESTVQNAFYCVCVKTQVAKENLGKLRKPKKNK